MFSRAESILRFQKLGGVFSLFFILLAFLKVQNVNGIIMISDNCADDFTGSLTMI